jgi:galactokinase
MKEIEEIELFVPGRLCIFGEHSDWAGGHRRQNSEIEKGYAIVAPTNQGNYARAKKIKEPIFCFESVMNNKTLEVKLEEKELLKIAEKGGIFSYVAGVAHEVISSYHNENRLGINIENYKSDIPIKKGLSSSASICVLVAKAFNKLYDLKWKPKRIMEIAYLGEITTPSRCGRLDQACAYENPILMTFDSDKLDVSELKVGEELYFLIVDLKKGKDTKKILAELNKGFPFPTNDFEKGKHNYLGPINKHIVKKAIEAIESGDAKKVGKLMTEAQEKFDKYLGPACPEELKAPKLHEVLFFSKIQEFIYGGKGVGSQGDGTAQLICKTKEDREKVKKILEKELSLKGLELDLKKNI